MTPVRDDVAAMLRQGATYRQIMAELHVGHATIRATREALADELPPTRAKRRRAELDALEPRAIAMLREGATYQQIRRKLGLGLNHISRLRTQHNIPVPDRDHSSAQPHRRSIDEAFTHYTLPTTTGGHLLWTGPRSGRGVDLIASGRKHNARHIAFQKHHGREPEGRVWRTCDQPACIAGTHHTDKTIRDHINNLYNAIFEQDA